MLIVDTASARRWGEVVDGCVTASIRPESRSSMGTASTQPGSKVVDGRHTQAAALQDRRMVVLPLPPCPEARAFDA